MKKYFTLLVAGEEYKLRLTAGSIMAIEKKLQKPLFAALESIQENMVETITTILWGAIQPLNANFSYDNAVSLFDDYIDEGHSIEDMMKIINGVFEASGFFKKGQEQ